MTRHILVVEDQEDNRQIVRDLLTANDYEMTEAENGDALAIGSIGAPLQGMRVNSGDKSQMPHLQGRSSP